MELEPQKECTQCKMYEACIKSINEEICDEFEKPEKKEEFE